MATSKSFRWAAYILMPPNNFSPKKYVFEIEFLTDSFQINLSLILDGLTKEEEKMYRWQRYSQKIKSNQQWQIWKEKFFVTKSSTVISGSCRRLCSIRLTQRWASERLWLMSDIWYIFYSYINIYFIDIYHIVTLLPTYNQIDI